MKVWLTALTDDQPIFVFGSNLLGIHGRGAALTAKNEYAAEYGVGVGPTGHAYAIPTKATPSKSLYLSQIYDYVDDFIEYAMANQHLVFFVTRIGCGLAGYTDTDIAPMFYGAPDNCLLPDGWRDIIAGD